jgi:hypothetical protein
MSNNQLKKNIVYVINQYSHKDDIKSLSLFGSYASGKPDQNSDIDLLIEFKPKKAVGFFKLVGLKNYLKDNLKKEVDLVTPEGLSKYIKKEVLENAQKIY